MNEYNVILDADMAEVLRLWTGGVLGKDGDWYWSNGEKWDWNEIDSGIHEDHIYLMGHDDGHWGWHGNDGGTHYPVLCETHY